MSPAPDVTVLPPLLLAPFVMVEGRRPHRAAMGMWATYLPATGLKLLHAVGGRVHCIARSAPPRGAALPPERAHWAEAFARTATRRAAENWVMARRLHGAGLGPEPLGLAVAPRYRSWFSRGWTSSAGLYLANLHRYPPKAPTTEAEMRAAGVIPDGSRSALREQINGYVSDLNSARGAMPEDAEAEVAAVAARLDAALAAA